MSWMLKNSAGRPDAMLTAAMMALGVVLLKVLTGGLQIGGVQVGPAPDPATITALLTPTLGAYVMRRNGILGRQAVQPKEGTP